MINSELKLNRILHFSNNWNNNVLIVLQLLFRNGTLGSAGIYDLTADIDRFDQAIHVVHAKREATT